MNQTSRRNRPGRPRHVPETSPLSAREHILDVGARLFVQQGFAKTSTREIADAVGIRQASFYYHFAAKEELLEEIIGKTIRPTLDHVQRIEGLAPDPATALYLLALIDVRTLADAPHNSGLLGLLPDVAKHVPEFADARAELANEYARIGKEIARADIYAPFGRRWGYQLMQQVEGIITWIADDDFDMATSPDVIAGTCLRVCDVHNGQIDLARTQAHILWEEFEEEDLRGAGEHVG